ncbi:MAG: prolyl oligopeptidase family serine peptidase [Cyanobacteria bacterium SZAS-4]|nr:prolyl oligopeptidase family serine peptidase [Cyanobacteria bacterium SZAS-4]
MVNRAPRLFSKPLAAYPLVLTTLLCVSAFTTPCSMAQSAKELLKGEFSDVLGSLRSGTGDPKESNEKLQLKQFSVKSNGVDRIFFVHLPPSYTGKAAMPLVLAFHGAGSHARAMPKLTGLNQCADQHSFIVVYPDGLNTHWNDGNGGKTKPELEDVDFVKVMLNQISKQYKIDKSRIYAGGMSNGGFFSQYLALTLPGTFAAIASVAASLEIPMYTKLKSEKPISVLLIHGDDDDVVPFTGGSIGVSGVMDEKTVRKCTSAAQAVQFWVKADQCSDKNCTTGVTDAKPKDGTQALRKVYSGGKDGVEVVSITVLNGGHTWPGGWQYLPEAIVGKTSRAVNATDEMWNLFQRHHL